MRSTGVKDFDSLAAGAADVTASTAMTADSLKLAISVVPELTERKRMLDSHLQLSTAILDGLRERDWPVFFNAEQGISELTKPAMLSILRKAGVKAEDKLRTFLVFYMAHSNAIQSVDMLEYEHSLKEAGCSLNALRYLQQSRPVINPIIKTASATSAQVRSPKGDLLKGIFRDASGALGNFVSSFLSDTSECLLTRQVDASLEALGVIQTGSLISSMASAAAGRADAAILASIKESLVVFDPLLPSSPSSTAVHGAAATQSPYKPQTTSPQRSAYSYYVCFLIGGATYTEYAQLVEHMSPRKRNMPLTFGASEMWRGNDFVDVLAQLYRP